jgi:hypothetical protein
MSGEDLRGSKRGSEDQPRPALASVRQAQRAASETNGDCVLEPLKGVIAAFGIGWPFARTTKRNAVSPVRNWTWIEVAAAMPPFRIQRY